jgi:hypothetical protein
MPDGDECIVGLMAKHLLEGKELPLFFYGQNYGLSLFEAGITALFFSLFGISSLSLKLAMLFFFSLGAYFFLMAIREISGKKAFWIAFFLLALCPAWFNWSMKARGGYITAFVFSSLCLWLFARLYKHKSPAIVSSISIGVFSSLIFFSQPIWFLSILPFFIFVFYRRRKLSDFIYMVVFWFLTALFILWARSGTNYWFPNLFKNVNVVQNLFQLPKRIFIHITGQYFLQKKFDVGVFTFFSSMMWMWLLFGSFIYFLFELKKSKKFLFHYGFIISIAIILIFLLMTNTKFFMFRYLLPLTINLIGFVSIQFANFLNSFYSICEFSK